MISASLGRLRETRPHEYAARFAFGGLCTAAAGWIATRYGPEIGGLFLAFPAVFPAGATLIASHEKKRKARAGMGGAVRGRQAAALDAAGASLGGIALGAFAVILWFGLPSHSAVAMIATATLAWALISGLLWLVWKRSPLRHRRQALFEEHRHAVRRP